MWGALGDEQGREHDAAGHAEHFLERLERLDRERVELALTMYRDHEMVSAVLARLPVGEGAPRGRRVAFALAQGAHPPYVLVTHDGRFVTCLAEHMEPTDCFVVEYERLVKLVQRVLLEDERARVWKERQGRHPKGPLGRLVHSDAWVPREDITAMLSTQPLLQRDYVRLWFETVQLVLRLTQSLAGDAHKPAHRAKVPDKTLLIFWRAYHSLGHLALAATAGGVREVARVFETEGKGLTFPPWTMAVRGGLPFVSLQTLSAIAHIGRPMVPMFKSAMTHAVNSMAVMEAALPLTAIAARHESVAEEIRKVLASDGPPDSVGHKHRKDVRVALDMLCASISDDPERTEFALARIGLEAIKGGYLDAAERGVEVSEALIEAIPELTNQDLCAAALTGFPREEDLRGAMLFLMSGAAWSGRADAEDFYLPELHARLLAPPWSRDAVWELISALAKGYTSHKGPAQAKAPERPGRNDPCSCSSGKKYKKCCGA